MAAAAAWIETQAQIARGNFVAVRPTWTAMAVAVAVLKVVVFVEELHFRESALRGLWMRLLWIVVDGSAATAG